MKYTFEITIAGCSTNCAHCYVNGGPAPSMALDDFRLCTAKLRPVLDRLTGDISVTLGNEMFCHPQITDILQICGEQLSPYVTFRDFVPTTGLALLSGRDLPAVLECLRTLGASGFMLALHGDRHNHDQVTRTPGSFDGIFHAADILTYHGFDLLWNLMVSRLFEQDVRLVLGRILSYGATARFTVPLYVPTTRMRSFQSLRADSHACRNIARTAVEYGLSDSALLSHCAKHSEAAVLQDLQAHGFDYKKELRAAPNWSFFHITQELDFYHGNVGAHTQYLGNLRTLKTDTLLSALSSFGPNYDWNAFYDDSIWEHLCERLLPLPFEVGDLVYPSKADCLYAWLDHLKVPSKLLWAS